MSTTKKQQCRSMQQKSQQNIDQFRTCRKLHTKQQKQTMLKNIKTSIHIENVKQGRTCRKMYKKSNMWTNFEQAEK